jgi:hypothetical protein
MAWGIVDKGVGANDLQSIMFSEYLGVLLDGVSGTTCVLSGGTLTAGANMTPTVNKAAVLSGGVLLAVASATVTIGTADATNPRIDLVVVNSAGTKAVRAGTAAANPKPPARTAGDVVLAAVYVPAGATTIAQNYITDLRVLRSRVTLKATTAAVTFNTTLAIQTYFTVTLPSGLLLAGQQVALRCGGTMLLNSGTPTVTLTIAYGGTTMVADVSSAATADTDRLAWYLDFVLNASTNTAQQLTGVLAMSPVGAKTAPTTGIGIDLLTPAALTNVHIVSPLHGTAAVDSDAADRTLTVQWTMSVSNAADEISMLHATCELL